MEKELENLKTVLTSPRERAPGTISSYLQTATIFLTFHDSDQPPSDMDYRKYFIYRRENGISERTLGKEFVQLKKLASANSWAWPFTSDDKPAADDEPFAPAHTSEEIKTMIEAREEYSKAELFYLAICTTWGLRREEMVRIKKRDYNTETIKFKIAKQKKQVLIVEHLIPEEIKDVLIEYHPKLSNVNSFSYMYYRITDKAGIHREKRYGWHSIRRSLETVLSWNLAEARLPLSLVADFMSWSKQRKGIVYGGAPMMGVYDHPEILQSEPFVVDRLILGVHPFLKLWNGNGSDSK